MTPDGGGLVCFLTNDFIRLKSSFAFYGAEVSRLLAFPEPRNAQIYKIKPEVIARFAGARKAEGISVRAINGDLRTLRRILRLASSGTWY